MEVDTDIFFCFEMYIEVKQIFKKIFCRTGGLSS